MYCYATYNTHADLSRNSHGFCNTWTVVRFENKSDRDEFLLHTEDKLGSAVTRARAIDIHARNYYSVGEAVPKGGLFPKPGYYGGRDFDGLEWNEFKLAWDIPQAA